jgi:hypothetical protein
MGENLDGRMALAFALSKLLENEQDFKTYLLNAIQYELIHTNRISKKPNEVTSMETYFSDPTFSGTNPTMRVRDVLVYDVIVNPVFKQKINAYLKEIDDYEDENDPVISILDEDPLCSIVVPIKISTSCNYMEIINSGGYIPFVAYDEIDQQNYFLFGYHTIHDDEGFNVCGFYITDPKHTKLINPNDYNGCEDGIDYNSLYKSYLDCQAVVNIIQSKPAYGLRPSCVLLDWYDDLSTPYLLNCFEGDDIYSYNVDFDEMMDLDPPADIESLLHICPRFVFKTKYPVNTTFLNRFDLTWESFFPIYDNHLICRQYRRTGKPIWNFVMGRSFIEDGRMSDENDNLRLDYGLSQIVYKGEGKKKISWLSIPLSIFTGAPIPIFTTPDFTYNNVINSSLWNRQPFLYFLPVNENLFSRPNDKSNWQPDNQGDLCRYSIREFTQRNCNNEAAQTWAHQLIANIKFADPLNGSLQWSTTLTNTLKYSTSGVQLFQVGFWDASYCEFPITVGIDYTDSSTWPNIVFWKHNAANSVSVLTYTWFH